MSLELIGRAKDHGRVQRSLLLSRQVPQKVQVGLDHNLVKALVSTHWHLVGIGPEMCHVIK